MGNWSLLHKGCISCLPHSPVIALNTLILFLCHCGTDLHMKTDCAALDFSTNSKWKFTITKQLSNKTEVISTLPAGEQVPMTEACSSKKLQSRNDQLLPHFLLWVDGQISPFQVSILLSLILFVQTSPFSNREQFTPFLMWDLRIIMVQFQNIQPKEKR